MSRSDPILIVGAGIGGLTAALALQRKGLAVTLLEQRTGFAEAGAGIQLSPNASRVLTDLGLAPALARYANEPEQIVIRSMHDGRRIGTVPLGRAMRERHGAPYLAILRADLHTVLLDQARACAGIRLLVGRRVVKVATADGEAVLDVETEGGQRAVLRTPLAIGADGLWSVVREAVGGAAEPRFRNYSAWRAMARREAAPRELQGNDTGLWLGRDAHAVHYPVAGRLINLVIVGRSEAPLAEWSTAGDGKALIACLPPMVKPLRALVESADDWRVWSLFDLAPQRRWSRGRLTLLGDAAHPVLPFLAQGAALAIEDAAVLAALVAAGRDRIEDALRDYERARRARASRVQREARRNGRIYHLGETLAPGRDIAMRVLGPERMANRYDWLYGWRLSPP